MIVTALTALGLGIAAANAAEVSAGTSVDLEAYNTPYATVPAAGVSFQDVVGIAIAGSNDHVYVWYGDGTVSSGTTRDLDAYRERRSYALPAGYAPDDIVGIGIAGSNDRVYAWYRDGMVSSGTSTDLAKHNAPYAYVLPPRKGPLDIVGIGIAGSDDHVWVWYADGQVSSGTTRALDLYRTPQGYSAASGWSPEKIAAMAVAGSNDHVYAWYAVCDPPEMQILSLSNIPQETGQWCWAASGQMIMQYVGNVTVPQCVQANDRLTRSDCCNMPTPVPCIEPNWPDFARYDFTSALSSNALRWKALKRQIATGGSCRGRPFAFVWRWYAMQPDGTWALDDTAHMMVATGYRTVGTRRFVYVQDPAPATIGDFRIDDYEVFVRLDNDHEHGHDPHDVNYRGGR